MNGDARGGSAIVQVRPWPYLVNMRPAA